MRTGISCFGLLAVMTALVPTGARACPLCWAAESEGEARPIHVPADISKEPVLDSADISFIEALGEGKRYARLGDYIIDKAETDPWLKLLDKAAVIDLLRPRASQVVAALQAKAQKKALSADDLKEAEHQQKDLAELYSQADRDFLRGLIKPQSN